MNARAGGFDHASTLARAVLYDGCVIYPYRLAPPESRRRAILGNLFPPAWRESGRNNDPSSLELECLVRGGSETELDIRVCFLHFIRRQIYELTVPAEDLPDPLGLTAVHSLHVAGELLTPSEEACDREFRLAPTTLGELARKPVDEPIAVPPYCEFETVREGGVAVAIIGREAEPLQGQASVRATQLHYGLWRLTVTFENRTSLPEAAHRTRQEARHCAFGAANLALRVEGGEFVSLNDPSAELQEQASACANKGVWPVLLGTPGAADLLFASPIILPDYPEIAESGDDLLDAREVGEVLARSAPEASRRAPAARGRRWPGPRLASIRVGDRSIALGDRVRLKLRQGSDLMDVVLAGLPAVVEAIQRDSEGRIALAVTIEDDAQGETANDGLAGRRVVYALDEVEPLGVAEAVA